ncbi:MAG: ribonucleotide reductase subunit alpha [Coriobacteriaceae bacterium]|jgi:hypothetical protein|nr:ribonucleotide reductase subunit alpha [Coriobacteriaceae bacterium]
MNENDTPNRGNGCSEYPTDYLARAAEACAAGDLVLGMHLYLAAYEESAANPNIPDGMALTGLREAWHLACDLKERSMAEYVFEKLEPYLMPDEIAEYASQLQDLALDRLENLGFSREELQDVAQMIAQEMSPDGMNASVVKVESVSIPHAEMFGVPMPQAQAKAEESEGDGEGAAEPALDEDAEPVEGIASEGDDLGEPEPRSRHLGMSVASADDFNPYDMYRDYSIGKSWHAATVEGSGAEVFTRDDDRARAHEEFVNAGGAEALAAGRAAEDAAETQGEEASTAPEPREPQESLLAPSAPAEPELPSMPKSAEVLSHPGGYDSLAGYDEVVSVMRGIGIGMQNDREYLDFVSLLNERHGLDRVPALDSLLLRAPAIEDANRFAQATIEELGLPALHMSMEENVMGVPVLCITAQGNNRPRMNHAHNRFEAPAVLVIQDLDMWTVPEAPEGVEGGMGAFIMANVSRGAREAMSLIRASVEDPDVCVIATATTFGDVDPFYYDMLEPMAVIDIANPTEKERAGIWDEVARDHPSMRGLDRDALVRFSEGVPRYDIYLAVREALEEAYKQGLMQREYLPVVPQNIFEKLAACQPVDSAVYRELEEAVVRSFKDDLEHIDDLLDDPRD